MTPTKRLSVKKPPKMMKTTKYKYMYLLLSHLGCKVTCEQTRWGIGRRGYLSFCLPQKPTLRRGPGCRWFIWEVILGSRCEGRGGVSRNRRKAITVGKWDSILRGLPKEPCKTHLRT